MLISAPCQYVNNKIFGREGYASSPLGGGGGGGGGGWGHTPKEFLVLIACSEINSGAI